MIKITLDGVDELLTTTALLEDVFTKAVEKSAYDVLEVVDNVAVRQLGTVKHGNGEINRSSQKLVENKNGEVLGRYWNDNPIAMYREFGTGPVGASNHSGISPNVTPTYRMKPWSFKVSDVDVDLTSIYGMRRMNLHGEERYVTRGQPARPWLYPAAQEATEKLEEIVQFEVNKALGELRK